MSLIQKDPFKFSLQEEKYNFLKKETIKQSLLLSSNNEDNIDNQFSNTNKNIPNTNENFNQTNAYLNKVIASYRNEVSFLKIYIQRLNNEIRKHLKIEIPFLYDYDDKNVKEESLIKDFFTESYNRLLDFKYLNPIFSIYDNHVLNLENEVKVYSKILLD